MGEPKAADAIGDKGRQKHTPFALMSMAFLVTGNVLGVGVLALPVKAGVAGFVPGMIGIVGIWFVMLTSAFVIASRLPVDSAKVDLPSFYKNELGTVGKWLAIVCNLILLYGVLVAYLSGISSILRNLVDTGLPDWVITVAYFILASALIMFGMKVLRKGNTILLLVTLSCFIVLVVTGFGDFEPKLLTYQDWGYLPLGLPIAVSAFHFHNIIPTVSRGLGHDLHATKKAILIGVGIGLLMNVLWVLIVLGTMPEFTGPDSVVHAYVTAVPATVPMSDILNSRVFTVAGLVFALLAVTASYMANGTGLLGFTSDMAHTYLKIESRAFALVVTFAPPLIIALVYPDIFLVALDIVGGIGETVLFVVLPAVILIRIIAAGHGLKKALSWGMLIVGVFIVLYVVAEEFKMPFTQVHERPTSHQTKE